MLNDCPQEVRGAEWDWQRAACDRVSNVMDTFPWPARGVGLRAVRPPPTTPAEKILPEEIKKPSEECGGEPAPPAAAPAPAPPHLFAWAADPAGTQAEVRLWTYDMKKVVRTVTVPVMVDVTTVVNTGHGLVPVTHMETRNQTEMREYERLGDFVKVAGTRLVGHSAPVVGLDVSADGQRVVTCAPGRPGSGAASEVYVWDAKSGSITARLPAPPAEASSVAFSPDGRYVAAGSDRTARGPSRQIKVWEVATGKEVWSRIGAHGPVLFGPSDGQLIGFGPPTDANAGGDEPGVPHLWDFARNAAGPDVLTLGKADSAASSRDSPLCAVLSADGYSASGSRAILIVGYRSEPTAADRAFSPHGAVKAWDLETGDAIAMETLPHPVASVSPQIYGSGWLLVHGADAQWADMMNFYGPVPPPEPIVEPKPTDQPVPPGEKPSDKPADVGAKPADRPPAVRLHPNFNRPPYRLAPGEEMNAVACLAGAVFISAGEDGAVRRWFEEPPEEATRTGFVRAGPCSCLAFSPDGGRLAAGGKANVPASPGGFAPVPAELVVWDVRTGARLLTDQPDSKTADVGCLAYTPDGDCLIYTAGSEVKRWDGIGLKPIPRWKIDAGAEVRAITVSPDGRRMALAVAAGDGVVVRLLDAADGRQLGILGPQPGAVRALAFSPDGKRLVGSGSSARVWDVESRQEPAHLESVTGVVSFSPDGACLVRREGPPGVWDAVTGAEIVRPAERRRAFPGGRTVEMRDERHSLMYDVATGQPILEWPYAVAYQAFSPDGRRLAVACDGQIRLLDAEAGDAGALFEGKANA